MISLIGKWLLVSFSLLFILSSCAKNNHGWIIDIEGGESCVAYFLWGTTNSSGESNFEDEVIVSFPFSVSFFSKENVIVTIIGVGFCANPDLALLREFDNSIPSEIRDKVDELDYLNDSEDVVLVKIYQDGTLIHSDYADVLFDFFRVF